LPDDDRRLRPSNGSSVPNDQERSDAELQPITPSSYDGSGTRETRYDATRYHGTSGPARRPSISRDDPYRQQALDESINSNDSSREHSTFGDDPYQAAPSRSRSVPYLKPIPDLKRQQRSEWDAGPIPGPLDDSAERTAQRRTPQRDAVPINWSQVDIGRQGSITRVPVQIRPISQESSRPQIDYEDEGGWRRARR
jgi:hypothetical protein